MSTLHSASLGAHPPAARRRWFGILAKAAATAVAGLVISACGGSSGGDGGTPPVVMTPTKPAITQPESYVSLTITDAQTDGLVLADATVTLSGPDVDKVVDAFGASVRSIKTKNGLATFVVKNAVAPTAAAPVVIQVGVTATGYLASGTLLTIGEAGAFLGEVKLIRASFDSAGNLTDAPAGVTGKAVVTTATAGGALGSNTPDGSFTVAIQSSDVPVAVTTAAGVVENVPPPAASISIPAGVRAGHSVTSASGVTTFVPAAPGPITASAVAFTPQSTQALATFPGGFNVLPSAGGGVTAPSVFQTAGFAAFTFTDSAGSPVDRFSAPVTLTIEAPASTVTPSGSPLSLGAVIPVWSYSASTAQWASEGSGTVVRKASNGNWVVSFQATHLSYWNLDWFEGSCSSSTLQLVGRPVGDSRPLIVDLQAEDGRYWSHSTLVNDSELVLLNAPSNMKVTVNVYDYTPTGSLALVGKVSGVSLCGGATLSVPITVLQFAPPAFRTLHIEVVERCPDGSNVRGIGTTVVVRDLETDVTYTFTTNNDGFINWDATHLKGRLQILIYSPREDTWWGATHGAPTAASSGVGITEYAVFDLTMPCNPQPQPTGGTGGTGGSGGSGGSGST